MAENNENIIPGPWEQEAQVDSYYGQYLFDATKDYERPPFLFSYKDVPFCPLGEIQAVAGQKKNGKTFFLTMIMAAGLQPDSERVKRMLPGLKCNTLDVLNRPMRVLYVDTEMGPLNTMYVQRRIHWLCGWPLRENHERFKVIRLRTMTDGPDGKPVDVPQERAAVMMYWVKHFSPDMIVLDGIRDMVHDMNDNAEAVAFISKLMKLSEERNICIWNALHYNPRPGADTESKMRGHLGTELGNKVSDTFACSKKKEANGTVSFKVKQVDARNKDVEDIHFIVDDFEEEGYSIPQIVGEDYAQLIDEQVTSHNVEDVRRWIIKHRDEVEWPAGRRELERKVFAPEGVGEEEAKVLMKMAVNRRLLFKQGKDEMKPGQKTARLKLNPEEFPF